MNDIGIPEHGVQAVLSIYRVYDEEAAGKETGR
jgi:hypothetical protein